MVKILAELSIKYFSRKLTFSIFSILAIIFSVLKICDLHLSDSVLMVAIPSIVMGIAIICVTYVTGLAKIDIQAVAGIRKDSQ